MSTSIKLKKSSISGRIPSLSDLDYGELAINYTDGVLYYKNSSNAIQKISGNAIGVDSDAVFAIIDSDYIQLRQDYSYSSLTGTPNILDSADVSLIAGSVSGLDSNGVRTLVDSAYVQARQTAQDFAYSSLTGAPNVLDSADVAFIVDSAYIQARQADIFRDSAFVTNIVDTAYIQARDRIRDSNFVQDIVDSAYVQLRQTVQDFAYSSLTGAPNVLDSADVALIAQANDTTRDSAFVTNIIDSAYIQLRDTPQDFAYSSLTGAPTAVSSFTNDANYLDSTTVQGVIDASYIQSNQITYNTSNFVDSAFVTAQIDALIDGAPGTLDTLNEIAAALNDDDSAYTTLVNLINAKSDLDSADALALINAAYIQSNQITYNTSDFADSAFVTSQIAALGNVYIDSAQVIAIIDSAVDQSFINNLDVNAGTLDGQDGTYFLDYNNFTNTPTAADFRDSAFVESIASQTTSPADSASVAAIVDSAFIQTLVKEDYVATIVDSAYVALRVGDFAENFGTVAVVGDLSIDATTGGDTITLQGGTGVDISSDVGNKRITISATPSTVYDFGTIAAPVQFTLDMGAI
jgi:hypothetical protein